MEENREGVFTRTFKLIYHYKYKFLSLKEKIKCAKYQTYYYPGDHKVMTLMVYNDKIFIPQKIKRYVVQWYPSYIIYIVLYVMKAIIKHCFNWPVIKCDISPCTK